MPRIQHTDPFSSLALKRLKIKKNTPSFSTTLSCNELSQALKDHALLLTLYEDMRNLQRAFFQKEPENLNVCSIEKRLLECNSPIPELKEIAAIITIRLLFLG